MAADTAAPTPCAQRRAGSFALELLAAPHNGAILEALSRRPMRLAELRSELGGPAQTTLRARLSDLIAVGAVRKRGSGVQAKLTDVGEELLHVVRAVERWLGRAPSGPIALASEAAKGSLKALVGGWESAMLRALAVRPLSLTQLDSLIAGLSYPALERRLAAMRATGLVERAATSASGTPYGVTDWARRAVGPLSAAVRFECLHLPRSDASAVGAIDVQAAFLLAVPICRFDSTLDHSCQLVAQISKPQRELAGVHITLDRGNLVEVTTRLRSNPPSWALASVLGWFDALVLGRTEGLRLGGSPKLGRGIAEALHAGLAT